MRCWAADRTSNYSHRPCPPQSSIDVDVVAGVVDVVADVVVDDAS